MMHVTEQFPHLKIKVEAIRSATNNFAAGNRIGRGGFGDVYKGELLLHKRQTMVAIKRLNRIHGQGDPEFWKEIIMLSQYRHDNIVSLLGFCVEGGEKILVYKFVSRRSLDLYLKSDDLTWIQRLTICIGAAKGLAHLHNPGRSQHRVLHRDVKSSNILLDEDWNAKIADMGLSKFGPANQPITFLVSSGVGTPGYFDPVYAETGVLTKESDVYSFGVVLFEVLCGRLSVLSNKDENQYLVKLVRESYKDNKINEIIHGSIKDDMNPSSLKVFSEIAYRCLKMEIRKRPLMDEVVTKLELALEHQRANTPDGIDPRMQALRIVETPAGLQLSKGDVLKETTHQVLRNDMYYKVQELVPAKAVPKVTEMIMELEQSKVLQLLESPGELKDRVAEVMERLEQHGVYANSLDSVNEHIPARLHGNIDDQIRGLTPVHVVYANSPDSVYEHMPPRPSMQPLPLLHGNIHDQFRELTNVHAVYANGPDSVNEHMPARPSMQSHPQLHGNIHDQIRELTHYMVGNDLYYQVVKLLPLKEARKVTWMLLELEQSKLLQLLESPKDLHDEVAKALERLQTNDPDSIIDYIPAGPSMQPLFIPRGPPHSVVVRDQIRDQIRELSRTRLGDSLYDQVKDLVPLKLVPNVTGMLLELPESEVVQLLNFPEDLEGRVAEAMKLLEDVHPMRLRLREKLYPLVKQLMPEAEVDEINEVVNMLEIDKETVDAYYLGQPPNVTPEKILEVLEELKNVSQQQQQQQEEASTSKVTKRKKRKKKKKKGNGNSDSSGDVFFSCLIDS